MAEDNNDKMERNEVKGTLEKENRLYKTALDHEIEDLQKEAARVGRMALLAGGAALGAFLLIKAFKKKKVKRCGSNKNIIGAAKTQVVVERPVKENPFVKMLKEQAVIIVAGLIKEKLSEFTGVEKRRLDQKQNELTGKVKSQQKERS